MQPRENLFFAKNKLPPKFFNDRDMPESISHRYPAHIVSHNLWRTMCIGEVIGPQESLEFTVM